MDRAIALAIHNDQIRQHGGSFGVRDDNALESALDRPRNRWHYEKDVDLSDLAAGYAFAIARSHPFVDGNKRTAFQLTYVFLGLNGRRLRADEDEIVDVMESVAAGKLDEPDLADWVRRHSVRRRRS